MRTKQQASQNVNPAVAEGSLEYALAKLKSLGLLARGLDPVTVCATPGTLRPDQLAAEMLAVDRRRSDQEKPSLSAPSRPLPHTGPLAFLAALDKSRRENAHEDAERRKELFRNLPLNTKADWVPLASHPGLALRGEPARPRGKSGRFVQKRLGLRRSRPSVKHPRLTEKVRHWAGRGILPEWHRKYFTPTQAGVASYILDFIKRIGICKEFNATIAHALDVCVRTVQRTIAVMETLDYKVRRGRFDARKQKNEATSISVTCSKVWDWIKRNAPGLKRPSKGIIESTFFRPCPDKDVKSSVKSSPDATYHAALCLDSG